MTIGTKAELKTAITDWSHRANLGDPLDDFISLAEARISRDVYFREQQRESDLVATPGSRFISLPVSIKLFVRPIELWLTTFPPRLALIYVDPARLDVHDHESIPREWTIDSGGLIAFDVPSDIAHTFTFRYVVAPNLASDTDTNWLLDEAPDVYLFAALIESATFAWDSEQQQRWVERYNRAISELKNKNHRTKAMELLVTDFPVGHRDHSNILDGGYH